jgi:hypothetical protein
MPSRLRQTTQTTAQTTQAACSAPFAALNDFRKLLVCQGGGGRLSEGDRTRWPATTTTRARAAPRRTRGAAGMMAARVSRVARLVSAQCCGALGRGGGAHALTSTPSTYILHFPLPATRVVKIGSVSRLVTEKARLAHLVPNTAVPPSAYAAIQGVVGTPLPRTVNFHDHSQEFIAHLKWIMQKDALGQDIFLVGWVRVAGSARPGVVGRGGRGCRHVKLGCSCSPLLTKMWNHAGAQAHSRGDSLSSMLS